jgi:predicted ATP-grasp superfamily ATP-dependent carboligase
LVDISDLEAVQKLAADIAAELVFSVSSDIAVPAVITVSENLGLPYFFNPEIVRLFDQKHLLRAYLNERNLSRVDCLRAGHPADVVGWAVFPCIVKPADSQGQRGVQKVTRPEDIAGAVVSAIQFSPTKSAIVENYLEGVEMSCNVLVSGGVVVVAELSERLVHGEHLLGVPKGHLIPVVNVSKENCRAADALVREVVSRLNIRDGALYFQMIVTPAGPRIVEIAPRIDGCHMWRLIKAARGFDLIDLTLRCLNGEKLPVVEGRDTGGVVYELQFQQQAPGTVFSKADYPVPPDSIYHEYRYEDGEKIGAINGKLEVVGYYVRESQDWTSKRQLLGEGAGR